MSLIHIIFPLAENKGSSGARVWTRCAEPRHASEGHQKWINKYLLSPLQIPKIEIKKGDFSNQNIPLATEACRTKIEDLIICCTRRQSRDILWHICPSLPLLSHPATLTSYFNPVITSLGIRGGQEAVSPRSPSGPQWKWQHLQSPSAVRGCS